MSEKKYKLHSKGENWWHFRVDQNSIMESFTVTRVHDGTIVLTGDMGCLAHRRTVFREDTPFPCDGTHLNYFLEKVYHEFECYIFNPESAIKELKEDFREDFFGDIEDTNLLVTVNNLMENYDFFKVLKLVEEYKLSENQEKALGFLGDLHSDLLEDEFYRMLNDFSCTTGWNPDWCESEYGKEVNPNIIYKFELLKVWGDYMWEEIEKQKELEQPPTKKEEDGKWN